MKTPLLTIAALTLSASTALAQSVCGPGNPLDQICAEQDDIRTTLTEIGGAVSGTATDLSALEARLGALQASVDALTATLSRLDSGVAALRSDLGALSGDVGNVADTADRIDDSLDAHRAAAHKFWVSPLWQVLEGASTTQVTALNLGSDEVEVVFTFFDRDGVINRTFSTSRLVPAGASITIQLDDRGIDPAQHGWFAVTAAGPVQVDGYVDFGRGDRALSREYTRRTLRFIPADCRPDPATWLSSRLSCWRRSFL